MSENNQTEWKTLILPAIDAAGNPLYPEMHSLATLHKMQKEMPYHFAAQYQQDPQPAGGGIFKPEWFYEHEIEPNILMTFLTVDTAETDKSYNDATVFSLWGVYEIEIQGQKSGQYGLHWMDCAELRIEPKDLEEEFMRFYQVAMKHRVKPTFAAIEKKSTGITLISILKKMQGINIVEVEQNSYIDGRANNKINRFLGCQQFVSKKLISLPRYGKHTKLCIEHCRKITVNDSHAHDDIADTMAMAIILHFVDRMTVARMPQANNYDNVAKELMSGFNAIDRMKKNAYR